MDIKNVKPNPNGKYQQGYFTPQNISKYIGDLNKIIYRSSLEKKFMIMCDLSSSVEKWSSEPASVRYFSPIDNKYHTYFIDFYVTLRIDEDSVKRYFVEIKPKKLSEVKMLTESEIKKMTPKKKSAYEALLKQIIVNKAKWDAAKQYAATIGCEFICWNEDNFKIK